MKYIIPVLLLLSVAISPSARTIGQEGVVGKRDALRIAVQKICPISGRELPKDKPLKQWTDPESKERFFICCENCLTGKPDPAHLKTILERQAKAQGECLVMDNAITPESKSQVIGGVRIFVCCPPCFKKVEKSQEKYFAKLDDLHAQFLKKE